MRTNQPSGGASSATARSQGLRQRAAERRRRRGGGEAACPRRGPREGVWGNREVPPAGSESAPIRRLPLDFLPSRYPLRVVDAARVTVSAVGGRRLPELDRL